MQKACQNPPKYNPNHKMQIEKLEIETLVSAYLSPPPGYLFLVEQEKLENLIHLHISAKTVNLFIENI